MNSVEEREVLVRLQSTDCGFPLSIGSLLSSFFIVVSRSVCPSYVVVFSYL